MQMKTRCLYSTGHKRGLTAVKNKWKRVIECDFRTSHLGRLVASENVCIPKHTHLIESYVFIAFL